MKISGQCLCGAVRYRGDADPQFQLKCYCNDCRKTSAAGHAAMMGFAASAISIEGEVKEYASATDSGGIAVRCFCPNCGSGVFAKPPAMSAMIFIRASTLDDPNLFSPQMAVYAARAPTWDPVNEGVPAFPQMPPQG